MTFRHAATRLSSSVTTGLSRQRLHPSFVRSPRPLSVHRLSTASDPRQCDVESNPHYHKYREKIERVQGPARPVRKKVPAADKKSQPETNATTAAPSNVHSMPVSYSAPPTLSSMMHTDLIADKTTEEIGQIWREYHRNKDCISATIPADVYVQLHTKAEFCPRFLYPLPQEEGYEFFYAQFMGHRFYFTSLIQYQLHQENAPISLTLTHYTDLQDTKGIVLMSGEVDTSKLSVSEAQLLANQVQLYYASSDPGRYALVKQFNHEPKSFDYQKVLNQLQCTGVNETSDKPNSD